MKNKSKEVVKILINLYDQTKIRMLCYGYVLHKFTCSKKNLHICRPHNKSIL